MIKDQPAIQRTAGFDLPIAAIPTDEKMERAHLSGVNAFTLLLHDYGEARMPVENFIAEGVTLLVGASKIGKSYLMLDLCVKVACGQPFLNMKTEKSPVWYFALEDSPRRVRKRLHQISGGHVEDDIADVTFIFEAQGIKDGFLASLEQRLAARKQEGKRLPGMIVVDTLQMVRGMSGASVNAYAADYQIIRSMKDTAKRFRVAIVLVHHTNKLHNTQDSYERVSGSTGLMGAADSTILMDRRRGEATARICGTGRDIQFDEFEIEFDDGVWKRADKKKGAPPLADDTLAQTLILAYQSAGGVSAFFSYEAIKTLCEETFGKSPFSNGREGYCLIAGMEERFRKEYSLKLEAGAQSHSRRGVRISAAAANRE